MLALVASANVCAADIALTLYRADGDALFDGSTAPIADGRAIVHEVRRAITLRGGREDVSIDGLPDLVDPESISIDAGAGARVLAQRVSSARDGGLLSNQRGRRLEVFGTDGQSIARGTLVGVDGASLLVRAEDGRELYVREYRQIDWLDPRVAGGLVHAVVQDATAGSAMSLDYSTAGLGWRAVYALRLREAGGCRMHLDALASIANRSGRSYAGVQLKLVAGAPNLSAGGAGPRMMRMKSAVALDMSDSLPEQQALGDYRSFAIDGTFDLPDASVSQVPLHAGRDLGCERRWLVEGGNAWDAPKPVLQQAVPGFGPVPVRSQLDFVAPETLPAGKLRVTMRDRDGRDELLSATSLPDTPKDAPVVVDVGVPFDLAATRERTAFELDRAARALTEGIAVVVTNSGDAARRVTLRERPDRWTAWTLVSANPKPAKQDAQMLQFALDVPPHGTSRLEYRVRYAWQPTEE